MAISPSDYALLAAGSFWDIRIPGAGFNNHAPIPEGWVVLSQYDISGSGENSSILGSGFSARYTKRPLVKLDPTVLRHPQGNNLQITPGMHAIAEINQGKRTVLEYLLSPVQKAVREAGRER